MINYINAKYVYRPRYIINSYTKHRRINKRKIHAIALTSRRLNTYFINMICDMDAITILC